ncbi:MAG TPA: hypothetical protein VG099_01450 [Gemmataceae bacterium]|jgi:hypothetical protein|nr:hypothetical protein [Gemmataceae bacterium]
MLISGRWLLCDDDIIRPIIEATVLAANGVWLPVEFLADVGADRTVFAAPLLAALALPAMPAPQPLGGVGGAVATVCIDTQIRLPRHDGGAVLFQGRFAAFTDPESLDMSVLGRDISNLFAVIVDRPGDVVCLLGQRHKYTISESS